LHVLLDRLAASAWSLGLFALNRGAKKNPPSIPGLVEKMDYDPTARYANLTGSVKKTESLFAHLEVATLVRGEMIDPSDASSASTREVVVKTYQQPYRKIMVDFCDTWASLSHPNVAALLGVSFEDATPSIVIEFCELGSLNDYLFTHREADSRKLIKDIATGLAYLHLKDVVHGSLHPNNVLIDSSGAARLCDFGRSSFILDAMASPVFPRYMPGELLKPSSYPEKSEVSSSIPRPTKASDVYAYSMITLFILTLKVPFWYIGPDIVVITHVVAGNIPQMARYSELPLLSPEWTIIEACWNQNPQLRPTMQFVTQKLESS